jgi:phage pi2 protein 07
LKALKGVTMIKAILRKYQLRKELFLFDIEEGGQVFIPYELS